MLFRELLELEMQRRIKERGIDKLEPLNINNSTTSIVVKGELECAK